MHSFLRSKAMIAGALIVAAVMLGVGFVPLFDGPGYESALLAGLIVPVVVAVVTALEIAGERREPFDAFCRGVANGGALAALAWLVTMVHGLRVGFCDALGGTTLFALGPVIGALLAGAWGALAGELAGGRARRWARYTVAVVVAIGGPLVSILLSANRFYTSPMIFAYDPFVGYFSGTLYDTIVDSSGLLTYRAGTAATLFAAFVIALHLAHDDRGRLAFQAIGRPGLLVMGALALAGSVASVVNGDRLRHWETSGSIATELGALIQGERCDVVYPRAMLLGDAQRFVRDCDAHVAAAERWLGTKGPPKLTAYLFADAAQKAAMMGAADTYIAKPWRREIYVHASSYPHPALGHEIVHVLAGSFARGPFKIAGSYGGWVPNPGLIEGLAVAASPGENELSPRDWAKAMKDLGLLPPLSRLFALGFLGENSGTAYTASGAFLGWVRATFGDAPIRAWYGGAELPDVVGTPWAALEERWHADLDKVALPEAARAQARARFDRPAIFGRRCPHVIDACRERGDQLRGAGDEEGAIAQYRAIARLDPNDASSRIGIALATLRGGRSDEATKMLEEVAADERIPRHSRDKALEALGDIALLAGDEARASLRYVEVMTRLVDEDQLRTIEVKLAASKDPRARPGIVALLLGTPPRGPDRARASALLAEWGMAAPDDGLPQYLLARQLVNAGELEDAAQRLDEATSRRLAITRVAVEADRLRLVAACGLADAQGADKTFARYAARPEVSAARRAWARELTERCTGRAGHAAAATGDR